ncbi:hypothetical protein [Cellulomonas sp. ES6]
MGDNRQHSADSRWHLGDPGEAPCPCPTSSAPPS